MPFHHEPDLDGDMTLSETESACEIEQDKGFQLVDIHFDTKIEDGQVFKVNKAGFNEKLRGRLKNLTFVAIKDSDNPAQIRADKENLGWTFICANKIFVKNATVTVTEKVMVFGKKNF